jgi:hypothetical protein
VEESNKEDIHHEYHEYQEEYPRSTQGVPKEYPRSTPNLEPQVVFNLATSQPPFTHLPTIAARLATQTSPARAGHQTQLVPVLAIGATFAVRHCNTNRDVAEGALRALLAVGQGLFAHTIVVATWNKKKGE